MHRLDEGLDGSVQLALEIFKKEGAVYPLTDKLLANLSREYARVPAEDKEAFVDKVRLFFKDIVNQLRTLEGLGDKERLQEMYEALDEKVATFTHQDTKCKRGCSACCYQKVAVSELEARVLANEIKAGNAVVDLATLRKQSSVLPQEDYNEKLARDEARCVFLRDGECSVYSLRPLMCRTYHVVTDPEMCDPYAHPGYSVGVPMSNTVEFIASAIFYVSGSEGPLSTMLLENLQKVGFEGA